MQLLFREEDHTYWLGERRLPSVSEIISPVQDFSAIPPDVLERKSAIGKAVHAACQIIDEGDDFAEPLDPLIDGYVNGWRLFLREHAPQWSVIEEKRADAALGYAGTPDRFGLFQGDEWCLDIKTVTKVSPATGLQTAGYKHLYGKPTARRGAVQLTPDGKYRLVEFKDPTDWPTFIGLLNVHNWKAKHAS